MRTVLGPKWELAAPIIAIFSLAFQVHLVTIGMDDALLSIQRTRPIFARQTIAAIVRLGLVFGGLYFGGLVGLLIGRFASAVIMASINTRLLCRELGLSARDLVMPHARTIVATAAMAGVSFIWHSSPARQGISAPVLALAADVLLGALVFSIMLVVLWYASKRPDGFEREVWTLVTDRFSPQSGA